MTKTFLLSLFILGLSFLSSSLLYAKEIHSERSLYRNIFVEDDGDKRCLTFSLKRKTSHQSCINKKHPKQLVFTYYQLLMSSVFLLEEPKNILIIGLGGGTLSNTFHGLFPQAHIDNVEIDPAVVKVAREYFNFIENKKISTIVKDGRIFVKRAKYQKKQYDLIILDAFNGEYIPEHLLTQEFLQEIKAILAPNAVLAANTFSSSELYHHESATYQSVFGQFYNVRFNRHSNRVILIKNAKQLPNDTFLADKAQQYQQKLQPLNADASKLLSLMELSDPEPASTRVLTDQYSPANLLNN